MMCGTESGGRSAHGQAPALSSSCNCWRAGVWTSTRLPPRTRAKGGMWTLHGDSPHIYPPLPESDSSLCTEPLFPISAETNLDPSHADVSSLLMGHVSSGGPEVFWIGEICFFLGIHASRAVLLFLHIFSVLMIYHFISASSSAAASPLGWDPFTGLMVIRVNGSGSSQSKGIVLPLNVLPSKM